jgi:hypothetical protein
VLLGFVALLCVWMHFCCCSGRWLCQGLQGAEVVCSRLVSCVGGKDSMVTG